MLRTVKEEMKIKRKGLANFLAMKEVLTYQVTMETNLPKHQKRDKSVELLRDACEDFQRSLKAQEKYPNYISRTARRGERMKKATLYKKF